MNIATLYTLRIFIARGIDHSTGGIGADHEYWKGVHPSNIHGEEYRRLNMGHRSTR